VPDLESYAFVLLLRGAGTGFSDDDLQRLQQAHLDHVSAMAAAGKLVAAGPFREQPDETLRGFCIYACPLEEARALALSDPSVQAGRLAVQVMNWLTPVGSVTFHRAEAPR